MFFSSGKKIDQSQPLESWGFLGRKENFDQRPEKKTVKKKHPNFV